MRYPVLFLVALALVSCNRDPSYVKQHYLSAGNKFFDAGRYREASIEYRRAIETDRKFGEAYYRLALTDLKENSVPGAVQALRRAVDLLPPGTPNANDATLKLSEILVVGAQSLERNEELIKEVQVMAAGLLKRNPNSWEGRKLTGDLALLDTTAKYRRGALPEAKAALADAIGAYRTALTAKPGDYIITMALGRTLVISGETGEAEGLFKSLTQKDKKNLSAYFELYKVYLQQRRFPEAEQVLKSGLANNPTNTPLHLELARFYYGTGRKDELLAQLNQMKSNLKEFPDAYMQSGDFFLRVGQYDEAIKQYDEGIQKDPSRKIAYLKHQIEGYVRSNKLDLAYSKNNEILKDSPKDPEARGLKATFALDKGEINQAEAELQAVVTAKPSNFVARFNLGRAHFAKGEYEQARQEFQKAVELNPEYTPARLALTQVALLRGDNEGAVHEADQIIRMAPGSIQGRIMKATALQREQKFDEARALLNPIMEKDPKQVETLLELGILDLNEKKYKDAAVLFHRATDAAPNNIRGLLGESRSLLLDGHPDKSVDLIRVESQKYPDRADLLRELGNAQVATGDFDGAIGNYQKAMVKIKDPRQQSDLWTRIGQAYHYRGDIQHSVEALEKSRQGMPDNVATLTNLAILYEELGRKDVAKKYYETAIKLDSGYALALNNLAYLISETGGDLNEALTYASRAAQKLPNYTEISDTLGWIYIKKNLTDNAIDTYKTLVVKEPQKSTFRYHYAVALYQKGDRENARKECQAALADKPKKAEENDIRQLMTKLG